MITRPMTSRDVAERLGITVETFYLNRQRYHLVDKMPRPLSESGRHKFDRASMEAWLTRHHPQRAPTPANDPAPPPMPNNDAEWSDFLHRHYAPAQ
ncbi:putative DNA-binding transcriptional regulator AlpA [Bradyrhizobium sp. USDA 3311]